MYKPPVRALSALAACLFALLGLLAFFAPVHAQAGNPHAPPDGSLLIETVGYLLNGDFYTANGEGGNARLTYSFPDENIVGFAWSPDGTRIAFATSAGVYLLNGDVTQAANLAPLKLSSETDWGLIAWGGDTLAWISQEKDGFPFAVTLYTADTRAFKPAARAFPERMHSEAPEFRELNLSVSPNGRYVGVSFVDAEGLFDIENSSVILGSGPNGLTQAGYIWHPAWHPSGDYLLYGSYLAFDLKEQRELGGVRLPSGERYTVTGVKGSSAAISPDGKRLVVAAPNLYEMVLPNGESRLMNFVASGRLLFSPTGRFLLFDQYIAGDMPYMGFSVLSTEVMASGHGSEITMPSGVDHAWKPRIVAPDEFWTPEQEGLVAVDPMHTDDQPWLASEPAAPVAATPVPLVRATSTPAVAPVAPTAFVSAGGDTLRMRTGPGTGYAVVERLPDGVPLRVMGRSSDRNWLNVRTATGSVGWVSIAYVAISAQVSALPVVSVAPPPAPSAATAVAAQPSQYVGTLQVSCQPVGRVRFGGTVMHNGVAVAGVQIVFKSRLVAGTEPATRPAVTNASGAYEHIVDDPLTNARAKHLEIWVQDSSRRRISNLVYWDTEGAAGSCNSATIDFLGQ